MNNKILLLASNLKALLSKEDMNVDSIRLLNDKPYATATIKKALTSDNLKTIETAKELMVAFNIVIEVSPVLEKLMDTPVKPQTEAERIQAMKDKYKKDNARS